ncbi:MAG: YiiX/YebB-like N1pC/P60 family cysteine hydrolase, partial [Propionibacteriaceae bacterium]|nr:YiiX/YebB-like N1pC/P60 family cysteine hydrolase [Propionibacteriaceae bacterium]
MRSEQTMASGAATTTGVYPKRAGTFLVTGDPAFGLFPTGHAAMVTSQASVIEAVPSGGVKWGSNNWDRVKTEVWGATVIGTTIAQDAAAASWSKRQVGKPYNWVQTNVGRRDALYCSQLVWAAFKDTRGISLDTSSYGAAIHPFELVVSSRTRTIYHIRK